MRRELSQSPEPKFAFGMRRQLSPSPEPKFAFGMGRELSLSPEPKRDFGMRRTLSPSPESKRDFGMRRMLSPSPEFKRDFGMRRTLSPSPESKRDFGMRRMLSPSPEPKGSYSMPATPPPSTEHKSDTSIRDFGAREPLFFPDSEDDLEMRAPLSPEPQGSGVRVRDGHWAVSPLPQAEDFGVLTVPEEGPSQIDTRQPTEAEEPYSSSSKGRGEFHIANSNIYLTLAHGVWKWGDRAPSPIGGKEKGQPGEIGEVDHVYESVC